MAGAWIEFAGPPGVGKTTTYEAIQPVVGLPGKRQMPSSAQTLHALLEHDACWSAFWVNAMDAYSACRRGRREPRVLSFKRYTTLAATLRQAGCLWLADDFLVQRGQSLAAAGPALWSSVERFFELVPQPAGLILLTADGAEVKRRNRLRRRAGKPDLGREFEVAARAFATALPILGARGFRMLELDAMRPSRETAAKARSFVETIIEDREARVCSSS